LFVRARRSRKLDGREIGDIICIAWPSVDKKWDMKKPLHQSPLSLKRLAPLVFLTTLVIPTNAIACCTTVWSCVAAVASQGLTCYIEISLVALRNLISQVERERYERAQAFAAKMAASDKQAAEQLQDSEQRTERAIKELEESSSEARKLVGDDAAQWQVAMQKPTAQQSAASTPNSAARALRPGAIVRQSPSAGAASTPAQSAQQQQAYSAAVNQTALRELASDNSLESMSRQIAEERRRGVEARQRLIEQKAKAATRIKDARDAATIAFQNSFLGRIDALLGALGAALANPLEATQLIDGALGILDGIVSGFDQEVTPAVEKDAAVKQAAVAAVQRPAAEAQKHAERARLILGEMRKSARFKTVAERRQVLTQLNSFLSMPTALQLAPATKFEGAEQLRLAVKKTSADLRLLRREFQRVVKTPAPDLRPARARVGQDFDQFFKGKTPAESKKTRDELLAEARRRFAGDAKLLTAVEKLIRDEARARGVF
jgi:molecular chaperone GrpE (heat shock protein)